MNKRNLSQPSLPTGFINIGKGFNRNVLVAVVDDSRCLLSGFDVTESAPNHFRLLPYGRFGVLFGASLPLEVRIMLDGKVLTETRLYPTKPPSGKAVDAAKMALMAEMPQPHFVMHDATGNPLFFEPHKAGLSPEKIVAEQLHPGRFDVPPSMEQIDSAAPPLRQVAFDLDLNKYGFGPPTEPVAPDNPSVEGEADNAYLADGAPNGGFNSAIESAIEGGASIDAGDQALLAEAVAEAGDSGALEDEVTQPFIVPDDRSMNWAPSHGFLAVGVRILQQEAENEPPTPPDTYSYVTFQLNPWNLHMLAHNRTLNRHYLPSKEEMRRIADEEGYGHEFPQTQSLVCGHNHDHNHKHKGHKY